MSAAELRKAAFTLRSATVASQGRGVVITPDLAHAVANWLETTARGIDPDRMSLTPTGPYVKAAVVAAKRINGGAA